MNFVKALNRKPVISGRRKAVILLTLLGNELGRKVLSFLTKKEKEIIKLALKSETKITEKEKIHVLKEFLSHANYLRTLRELNRELYFKIALFTAAIAISIILLTFKNASYELENIFGELNKFLAIGGGYIVLLPFIISYIKNKTGKKIIEYAYKSTNTIRDIFTGIIAAVIITIILTFLNLNITEFTELKGIYNEIYILVLVFLAPFCEELIFRGIIYDIIEKKFNIQLAILLSSIIFTIAHIPRNLSEFFLYFTVSFILAFSRFITSNLLAPTIAHCLANLAIYLLTTY